MDPLEGTEQNVDGNELQTTKSPFDILDEVEQEGNVSLAQISEEVEAEIAADQDEIEGEGTGLKADKKAEKTEKKTPDPKNETDEEKPEKAEAEDKKVDKKPDEEKLAAEKPEDKPKEEPKQPEKSALPQSLVDKIKDVNPDLDVTDEKAVQEAIDTVFTTSREAEQARQDLQNERQANKAFYDLLEGSEQLREVSRFMHQHNTDLPAALTALAITPETDLETLKKEDPDAYIEAVKTKEKREADAADTEAKRKKTEETFEANEVKSQANAEAVKKDLDMDDAAFNAFTEKVNPEIQALTEGLITKNLLSIFHRGLTYEEAIAKAREDGLTEGKNMKIDEHTRRKTGDNLPKIDTGAPKVAAKGEDDIWTKALQPEPRISEIQ